MGKEVYCSSSRTLYAQRAGAAYRSRTTRSWHQLPGTGSSVVYVREAQYACGRRVFGCDQVECMGTVYSRADSRLSTRMPRECMGREYAGGQRAIDTDTF